MRITIGDRTEKYLAILELKYPFSEEQLKTAFRIKAKETHPDSNKEKDSEDFRKVKEAAEYLLPLCVDLEHEKEEHVASLKRSEGDIFKMTRKCTTCGGKGFRIFPERSCEACSSGLFSIMLGIRGVGKVRIRCPECRGSGIFTLRSGREVECRRCKGLGRVSINCRFCKGTGVIEARKETCSICFGTGEIEIKPFNPVIPKGAVL